MKRWLGLLAIGFGVLGCSGPADVAGTYTIALTNRDNGCNFQNWTVGQQTTGVMVDITQSGSSVTADVQGLTASGLDLVLGSHAFIGTISGDSLDLSITGSRALSMGNCAYTIDAAIQATTSGDTLTGHIHYTAATNDNPDCATLQGCMTAQDFNGARPPQ